MIYSKDFVTSWHDTDLNRFVRPTAMLVYFEETSNLHVASMGKSLDEIRDEAGLGFILSRMSVRFYKPVEAYKDMRVDTFTSEGRAFSTLRSYRATVDGETVAEAVTVWALVDINEKKPVKISSYDFGFKHESPIELDAPQRVAFPKDAELSFVGERKVYYSDCDYNGHMNNTRYLDMICDFLPDMKKSRLTSITLSFVKEGGFGHTLSVYRGKKDENTYVLRTVDEEGNTCLEAEATVENI